MKRFDSRKAKIIQLISANKEVVTGKTLSLSLNLSLRTIQAEIAAINKELPLIQSSNRGYTISQEYYAKLNTQFLKEQDNEEHMILRKLIFDTWCIDELAEKSYMSTPTLERKIKALAPFLAQYQLQIKRSNMLVWIEGDEFSKRKLFNYLIFQEAGPAFNGPDNLKSYFPDLDVEKIKSIILNSINKYHYYVKNNFMANLILNIVIALSRMRSNNYIGHTLNKDLKKSESVEYKIALEICNQYMNHCHITPSESDIDSLAILLYGQILPLEETEMDTVGVGILQPEFITEISDLLLSVFNYYMINVDFSDSLYNFALHVDGMIHRTKNLIPNNNDLYCNIKFSCPFIYEVALTIARKIADKYGTVITDTEIGYISIHIGYLIEHSSENKEKAIVTLFCNDYYHMGDILRKKLLDNFSDLIELIVIYSGNTEELLSTKSDLIFTTQPLQLIGKNIVSISPFYTMMDHINVDNAIHACLREKEKNHRNQFLSSFFHENLFFRNNNFKNKEDVITFLGQKIIDFGLAEDGFIKSVLKRENLSSTCFFDTFAIPHAMDMNARKTMLGILISENGIPWDEHCVHIVLMIAVAQDDKKEFMKLYNGIVQSLENPQKVKQLISAKSHVEFINYLRS